MPHIAFELDAIAKVSKVARSADAPEGVVAWGLVQLWEWCWREKREVVSAVHLRGFFGTDLEEALVAFGFLEKVTGGLRVRGAQRYLRIAAARSAGGHAAKQHLVPGGGAAKPRCQPSLSPAPAQVVAEAQPSLSRAPPSAAPRLTLGSTASSEQRAANSEQRKGEEAPRVTSTPTTLEPGTLRDRLEATFQRLKGQPYRWRLADDNAVRELLAASRDDWGEVDRRWALALVRTRFPVCASVPELAKHWNSYATDEPKAGGAKDPHKAPVRAEDVPREAFAQTGDVTHEF